MTGSSFLLLLRLGLSLAVVLGLVWAAAKVLRSRGAMSLRPPGSHLEVLERRPVGKSASVALVRVGGRAVLLGVTESRVQMLQECPELDLATGDVDDVVQLGVVTSATHASLDPGDHTEATNRWIGSSGASRSHSARMGLMDALRDVTVRRAASSQSNP